IKLVVGFRSISAHDENVIDSSARGVDFANLGLDFLRDLGRLTGGDALQDIIAADNGACGPRPLAVQVNENSLLRLVISAAAQLKVQIETVTLDQPPHHLVHSEVR